MNPPSQYFVRLDKPFPDDGQAPQFGAQRVGFEWFAWSDQDALSRALQDGMFERGNESLVSKIESLENDVEDLNDEVASLEKKNDALKAEIEELKTKLKEAEK